MRPEDVARVSRHAALIGVAQVCAIVRRGIRMRSLSSQWSGRRRHSVDARTSRRELCAGNCMWPPRGETFAGRVRSRSKLDRPAPRRCFCAPCPGPAKYALVAAWPVAPDVARCQLTARCLPACRQLIAVVVGWRPEDLNSAHGQRDTADQGQGQNGFVANTGVPAGVSVEDTLEAALLVGRGEIPAPRVRPISARRLMSVRKDGASTDQCRISRSYNAANRLTT